VFHCQKHAGSVAPPPGGYAYEDAHWKVCHAPAAMAGLGTMIVESKRHVLDFTEMNAEEASSYGQLLQRLYTALKGLTGAERVYSVVLLEGAAHFHSWLVPRTADAPDRGIALLARAATCDEAEAQAFAVQLRARLAPKG